MKICRYDILAWLFFAYVAIVMFSTVYFVENHPCILAEPESVVGGQISRFGACYITYLGQREGTNIECTITRRVTQEKYSSLME